MGQEQQIAIKKANLYLRQLEAMREDSRHITTLEGITSFIMMFNRRLEEAKQLLAKDAEIYQSVEFIQPLSSETQESEYPSAIIDGKRGSFMVNSGILLAAIKDFIALLGDKA